MSSVGPSQLTTVDDVWYKRMSHCLCRRSQTDVLPINGDLSEDLSVIVYDGLPGNGQTTMLYLREDLHLTDYYDVSTTRCQCVRYLWC